MQQDSRSQGLFQYDRALAQWEDESPQAAQVYPPIIAPPPGAALSPPSSPLPETSSSDVSSNPSCSASQVLGLDPAAAFVVLAVEFLVFSDDVMKTLLLIPLGVTIAIGLGLIVYRIQKNSYGDMHYAALIKTLIVVLFTVAPAPLALLVAICAGFIGLRRIWPQRWCPTRSQSKSTNTPAVGTSISAA